MISKKYIVHSAEGLHARPATALVKLANSFTSDIHLKKDEKTIRLNSMLNILSMAMKAGDTLTITVEGSDEIDAAAAMDNFFTEQLKNL